jgi:hypothetical protein
VLQQIYRPENILLHKQKIPHDARFVPLDYNPEALSNFQSFHAPDMHGYSPRKTLFPV